MKSPIIYYGGKTSMLPVIQKMIPPHEVYTEVFFGGGALFWAKKPVKNETINDKMNIVINFYRQLKNNFTELNQLIQQTLFSRIEHKKALLIFRNQECFNALEKAWAFWMVSNFSYGNKCGGGLKYSNDQSILPPNILNNNKKDFTLKLVKRIEKTHIENRDAIYILKSRNVEKTFHYLDPPYENADQGHYRGYTTEQFKELLQWCERCKGKFLLSNYDSDLLQHYVEKNKWQKSEHTFKNKGMRKNDRTKNEILIWNYELPNKSLFD